MFRNVLRYARAVRHPSLASTLLAVILFPLLLITALMGWLATSQLERWAGERMQQDIELVARAIRLPLSHALERGYQRTVQRALESAFRIDRVYGAYVYDHRGELIAASGFDQGTVDHSKAARIASRGERQGEFEQMAGETVFSYFVPLSDAVGGISGLLQVTRKGSDFDEYLDPPRRQIVITLGFAGLVLTLLLIAGLRWIAGRHLTAIEDSLVRIGQGESVHRLPIRGPRELHRLAATINHMLDDLERSARQLERLRQQLHRSEKMAALGQLAAGVAHELGSPLSTIDGSAQRLLRHSGLPEPTRLRVERIRREAERMERIIRQLLNFGRSNPLELNPVAAPRLLRIAAQSLPVVDGVKVQIEAAGNWPQLLVDEVRIDQALANLLRNAVQAAHSQVRASIVRQGHWLCYHIDDDGPGISPESGRHLFEPFFTTKPVGKGTGLGLAVADAAARDHEGRVDWGKSPLGGARFTLKLPISPESEYA